MASDASPRGRSWSWVHLVSLVLEVVGVCESSSQTIEKWKRVKSVCQNLVPSCGAEICSLSGALLSRGPSTASSCGRCEGCGERAGAAPHLELQGHQAGDSVSGPQRREGPSVLPDAEPVVPSTLQATVPSRSTTCTVPAGLAFLLSLKALLRVQALLVFALSDASLFTCREAS